MIYTIFLEAVAVAGFSVATGGAVFLLHDLIADMKAGR